MSSIVDKQLLEFLRSALWGKPVVILDGFNDWGALFAAANKQSVLSLVANVALNDSYVANLIPSESKDKIKSFTMTNVATHKIVNNTLLKVADVLDQAEIPFVLLKGQAMARNYPIPELRACGDIDVYVGQDNYLKACELISGVATWKEDRDPIADKEKHFDVKIDEVIVEIHRYSDMIFSRRYNKIYQAYSDVGTSVNLREINIAGKNIKIPADDFNAFYVFNHMWRHFLISGVGLRQLCDWMMFLHARKDDIDRDKLRKIIEDMNLMKPWQTFGCILVEELGMPHEEFPFYDPTRKKHISTILKYILAEGNFGRDSEMAKNSYVEGYLEKKFKSMCIRTKREMPLVHIFPSHIIGPYFKFIFGGIGHICKDLFRVK